MSGDVQPRKRKDKKRKKDELGVEEPRGTAAVLGEGDVYMHSHHDHGTGGHWCAKIIFFSLLAVLITLIGLIILENRGLSELEANSVESRYSGVLEGWLEDVPDDDHHDEHTLELNHKADNDITHDEDTHNLEDEDQDDVEMEQSDEATNDEDSEEQLEDNEDEEQFEDDEDKLDDDDDDKDDQSAQDDDDDDERENAHYEDDDEDENEDGEESQEQDIQNDEEEEDNLYYGQQADSEEDEPNNDDNYDNSDEIDKNNDYDDSTEVSDINKNSDDNNDEDDKEEDEHEDEEENDDEEVELEKLEKEVSEEEPISIDLAALPEEEDDDDNDKEVSTEADQDNDGVSDPEEEEYLEADDDIEESLAEHLSIPPGKPLVEMEDDASSEQPPDTLAEEEEYEKRQEELRQEEEKSSHMWLKLTVGGALLVATHAVMRRATRDSTEEDEPADEVETSITDRRMTLISDEPPPTVPARKIVEEISQPHVQRKVESIIPTVKSLIESQESDKEGELESDEEIQEINPSDDKELYSEEDEEEIIEAPKVVPKQSHSVVESKIAQDLEPEELEDPDDVEIIDEEQLEEELEEEDEEEISDVDDGELLSRLEAKYGKLPEPERPGPKPKDGGNSIDDWPGEPSDAYWRRQLDSAERELQQGEWEAAGARAAADALRDSARARWIAARALDLTAEARRDNRILSRAITAYLHLLKMNERLPDKKLLEVTKRTLDRMQFRGTYLNAEPVYRLLIRRFPNEVVYRNNLTIAFLMSNRADLAEDTLKETLKLWPNDRVALAHYGFVLKTRHNRNEEAVEAFKKALEGDTGPATEPRFYYHYGDSLLLLNRIDEAHEVHKRGAALGHFLSPVQRSLYNVPRLKSTPWWKIEDTPYLKLARALEKNWKEILKEAEAAKALYEQEKEGLRERGEWSQLDLFVRGQEVPNRCKTAPITCSVVKSEIAAVGCRRGQVKFSAMEPGTHVRPHVGPTNCRLRMHLALSNTKDTFIRVDKEIRQWQVGKTFLFDDSFEHEVWHNGTATRLVLIVDVWHPHLTASERRQLPAI